MGRTTVTLRVTYTDSIDPQNPMEIFDEDTVDVSIADATPPTISGVSDPVVLWPPNHKMREVEVNLVGARRLRREPHP